MRRFAFVLCTVAFMGASAQAGLIVDNGTLDTITDRTMTAFRVADDFTLAGPANVVSAQFWMTIVGAPSSFSGNITYAIYNNSAGTLGSLVATNTVSGLTPIPTGGPSGGGLGYLVQFNLVAPVALGAGGYWLELHEGTTLTQDDFSSVYWATSAQTGNAKQDTVPTLPTTNTNKELAFRLFDTAVGVPEPGSITMIGLGLVALGFRARRQLRRG